VLLLFGALILLFGLLLLIVASAGYDFLVEVEPTLAELGDSVVSVFLVMGLILVTLGATGLAAAIGVFAHKNWGRWLGVVSASIGVLIGLFIVLIGIIPPVDVASQVFGLVSTVANALAAVGLAAGARHFQQERGYGRP
jgi:hypothetical protein